MSQAKIDQEALKQLIKEAVVETLYEQRDVLQDAVAEVLEDFMMTEVLRDVQQPRRSKHDIFSMLEGEA